MRIQINETTDRVFFTSDIHYSHRNICSATSRWLRKDWTRQHLSVEDMNDALIRAINSTVPQDAVLWILGDVAFQGQDQVLEVRGRIHCRRVHLVRGNHDKHVPLRDESDFGEKGRLHDVFTTVSDYAEIRLTNAPLIVAAHYPLASWNKDSRNLHLHGHLHSRGDARIQPGIFAGAFNRFDVGVDGSLGYRPYSASELLTLARRTDTDGSNRHD